MKNIIAHLNKVFDSRIRLGIMSVLMVNEWVHFKELKEMLGVTDGNLSSHVSALSKVGFIEVRKRFAGNKPQTSYKVTEDGRKAFTEHLNALESLLKHKK